VHHGKIKGSKIFVEWEVSEILINIEEESVLVILRRLGIRNPVQFI
jgi:hypothetical protein